MILLIAFAALATSSTKPVRLRNQVITPPPKEAAAANAPSAASTPAAPGLWLVQFEGPVSREVSARLAALGADLLFYVPEDAFVARVSPQAVGLLRAMPLVHWVGEFRPEYKVDLRLKGIMAAPTPTEVSRVSVLLAPRAGHSEVAAARQAFSTLFQESSVGSALLLRGNVPQGQLQALVNSGAVLWVEPAPALKLFDEVASKIVAGDGGPNKLLTEVLGLDGSGVSVAVADTGLNNGDAATMHPDLFGRTPTFFHYGTLTDAADEHSHGTHVAGIIAGNGATGETDENGALYGLGVAPGSKIITQRIFDAAGGEQMPPTFEWLTRDATRAGAVIGSNSWGTDNQGVYDTFAMEFDALVRDADHLQAGDQPYILEFSAGNAGPAMQTIGTPAVAKNVIATGASENDRPDLFIYADGIDAMADFSSRGPCADGRIKPDVVAPGTWIASLKSASATDENSWSPISENYLYMGGTSQAGPHVSGAAAVFVQQYRQGHSGATPSPALVKAALIDCAVDMDNTFGTGPVPNMDEGWGRVDLLNLLDSSRLIEYLDQTVLLTNSQVFERQLLIASRDQPLKVTLAYTDVPGFPGAASALVNDLDLEVVAPDGTLFRGNQFDQGESVPNPAGRDNLNNVEGVFLSTPQPGAYALRVRARSVVQDARQDTAQVDQDFALVVAGGIAIPGVGEISFDRAVYTAPALVKVTVVDTALSGSPNVQVALQSTAEPAGEKLLLALASSSGVYTGATYTARGPAAADGKLQVANQDTLQASFQEPNGGAVRTAFAMADLVPPVLTGVGAAPSFGTMLVNWTTDEPASSTVQFGTQPALASLTSVVNSASLETSHTVRLSGLAPGSTYYYFVASSDEAGNRATNSNGGSFFSFVAQTNASFLLVEQSTDPLFPGPTVAGYTDALNQLGVSYDLYDANTLGTPTLDILRGYPAVIFHEPEFSLPWTPADLHTISNYVSGGGGLFISSMEILSRLNDIQGTNFSRQVLQVKSFLTDENGSMGAQQVIGVPNDPIGRGLNLVMDYTAYDEAWAALIMFGLIPSGDLSDALTPTPAAKPTLLNNYDQIVGLRWQGPSFNSGRVVFLSFPLDAVPMGDGVNDRVGLLRNILTFLVPEAPNLASLSLDSVAYTVPSTASVQVGDSRLAGRGTVTAQATTTTDTAGVPVILQETSRKGLFVGTLDIFPVTNPPSATLLEAKDGDKLLVSFTDAAAGINLSASATIDTAPAAITNVGAEPEYITADIFWETSEMGDALVQYGESPLLGQTAYDASPTLYHGVTLYQLAPDHLYYYRVLTRDLAGNLSMDDNQGKLYTFRTLEPISTPWSDNMDSGGTNWTVLTAEGSQAQWQLGQPASLYGGPTSAHSPPDAWAVNLNGDWLDTAETVLASPALFLTNGNTATLTFWHWYDFTDLSGQGYDIEFGYVEIVVNNAPPVTLAQYSDVSAGWQQEQIDLSPYMGKLVYLAWHYFLFTLDPWPRPGWFVDDVSVSVSQVLPGTIQITNNLAESTWVLSGRTYLPGKGTGTVITNAGPGQYILEFGDVPYYQTPAPQTNVLVSGGTAKFQGNYTFPDANHNGISDLWETKYFGTVSPSRTATTDTDGDGATDLAEFLAGTDPTNASSNLKVGTQLLPNDLLNLAWIPTTGRAYQVESSTNGFTWAPVTDWIRSDSTNAITYQIRPEARSQVSLFRLRVSP